MRMDVPVGQVNYEPSSLGPDIARENAARGYSTFPNPERGEQLRIRPQSFADHYTQARMFFASQTEPEQNHIVSALVFELSRCAVPRVREAMLGRLVHVDETLALRVAAGLGVRDPIAPAEAPVPAKPMEPSPALSILAKAPATLEGRKVGCLITHGVEARLVANLRRAVLAAGAKLQIVAPQVGGVIADDGTLIEADYKIEGGPSVLFDAVAILPSVEGGAAMALQAEAVNFLRDAYAHLKVIAYLPATAPMLVKAGLTDADPETDPGLVSLARTSIEDFIAVAAGGRIWTREPKVRLVP
jgi:catalase